MNKLTISVAIAASVLCLPIVGQAASLAGPTIHKQISVKFGDLDLSSSKGVRQLYTRIRIAAGKACTLPGDFEAGIAPYDKVRCVRQAIDQAVQRANRPALLALHSAKSRGNQT